MSRTSKIFSCVLHEGDDECNCTQSPAATAETRLEQETATGRTFYNIADSTENLNFIEGVSHRKNLRSHHMTTRSFKTLCQRTNQIETNATPTEKQATTPTNKECIDPTPATMELVKNKKSRKIDDIDIDDNNPIIKRKKYRDIIFKNNDQILPSKKRHFEQID